MKTMKSRVATGLLSLVVALMIATAAHGSWPRDLVSGKSLGYAIHTPTTATTLQSTPDAGIALPAGARSATVCVAGKIRYFLGAATPNGTTGLWLEDSCSTIINDRGQLIDFTFIDDSSGASTVTVEFYGTRY